MKSDSIETITAEIKRLLYKENRMEKPRDFDPFGQAGLSPLATI